MAKEITASANLRFSKGGASSNLVAGPVQIDMAGTKYAQGVQAVGIADEVVNQGDVVTPGMILAMNLDATNYVELGVDGTNYSQKIDPGQCALFRNNGAAVHAKANTAPVNLQYLIIEN